jgi:uncharacterized protein YegP (UPF0339 family)
MKITVYRAADGWRWRAQADNGEIVSESGEAYENKAYAIEAAERFGPRRLRWSSSSRVS